MREVWREFLTGPTPVAPEQRVHMDDPGVETTLAQAIWRVGAQFMDAARDIVLVCIGTDRSTGDALGPLIGTHLTASAGTLHGCTVLGTLDNPVHAANLAETMDQVNKNFQNPFVLAVDASLGRVESVGYFTVGQGSLKPGAAVSKTLPPVGQVYVTGVVNVGGFMEYVVLQNTRLSLVFRMARVAAAGIARGVTALAEYRTLSCPPPPWASSAALPDRDSWKSPS